MKDNIYVHMPFQVLRENIDLIIKNQLNVEIHFSSYYFDDYPFKKIIEIQGILEENGVQICFHAPYMDLSPGGMDKLVRDITLKRMQQLLKLAEVFKPSVIIVHPGYDDWRYNKHFEDWLENSIETWQKMLDSYSHLGSIIALENVFEKIPDTLLRLIDSINSPKFRYCLDTGHFNLFSRIPLKEWFGRVSPYIVEVHLHDNFGEDDEHLAIGEGNFDFPLLFHLLEINELKPLLTIEGRDKDEIMKSLKFLNTL